MKKGLIICNIGDGKGKTTAAIGTAVRASGAGLDVLIIQFVKARGSPSGLNPKDGEWPLSAEVEFLNQLAPTRRCGKIIVEQVGKGFVGILGDKKGKAEHIDAAVLGLEHAREAIRSGEYDVIILDEIISAVELGLLIEDDIVGLLKCKPSSLHIVLTGHNKFKKIIDNSDVVTYMQMVKHPFYQGVLAQRGIDY